MSNRKIQISKRHSGNKNKKYSYDVNTDSVETMSTHVNDIKILIKPYENKKNKIQIHFKVQFTLTNFSTELTNFIHGYLLNLKWKMLHCVETKYLRNITSYRISCEI